MKNKTNLFHNRNAYNDLSIDNDILNVINRTITMFGKKKLHHKLAYCSSNLENLQKLSKKNYTIHLDLDYRIKMENMLNDVKTIEDSVEKWMLHDCNPDLLFKWNIFNNRLFLLITNKMKFSAMLIVLVFYILVFLYLYYYNIMSSPTSYVNSIVTSYYKFSKMIFGLIISNSCWIERSAIILTILYIGYQIYISYQSINTCYEHYGLCNSFYDEYEKIRKYVDIVNEMCKHDIHNDNVNVNESIIYLKYYFNEDSNLGFSLITKMNVNDYIKHVDIITNYIGRIDCQICIAHLLDEGYTIPSFVNETFPILHIDNLWNPILDPNIRVKNSLSMSSINPNVMILTGPNKAGKSTFMRSVITCIYISQSLGISCSDKMIITPFRDIFTYLNVPDCIGKESLFEAELNRCYNYIEKTESLRGFSIGIIDELFTGTNPKEGKAGSYAILKRISNNPTNITILSTHFHDILEKLDKNKFTFNKFTAKKVGNAYTYSYKIQNGISDQCIALELLKEKGFDKDIIDDAFNFLSL